MKNIFKTLRTLSFVIALSYPLNSYSCGNEYEEDYTKLNGNYKKNIHDEYVSYYYFNHGFDKQDLWSKKIGMEARLKENPSYKIWSDYSLLLLKLGEYKKGLIILEDLIKKYPKEYNIVVNLGTAYELNGRPDLALKYISEAVKINPGSHQGSEWIHVKILEAMLKMQTDKNYLSTHSVLELNFPNDLTNYYKGLSKEEINKLVTIKEHIHWQLIERISFVGPPNPVVADLLFDLANLIALTESIERSIPVYDQSLKYMPVRFNDVMERRDTLKENLYWTNFRKYSYIAVVIFSVILVFVFLIKRIRKRKNIKITMAKDLSI